MANCATDRIREVGTTGHQRTILSKVGLPEHYGEIESGRWCDDLSRRGVDEETTDDDDGGSPLLLEKSEMSGDLLARSSRHLQADCLEADGHGRGRHLHSPAVNEGIGHVVENIDHLRPGNGRAENIDPLGRKIFTELREAVDRSTGGYADDNMTNESRFAVSRPRQWDDAWEERGLAEPRRGKV
jgi:hypothetical protein